MHRTRLIGLSKRRLIQLTTLALTNPLLLNLIDGRLYKGALKNICAPGLNCWSCPAAVLACPIGAIQAIGGSMNFSISFYTIGVVILIGLLIGRVVCGYLCPFGLFQELLFKIPTKKFTLPRGANYAKYFVLIVFVLIMPIAVTNYAGTGAPTFCEYICPAGTLEAGIPMLITHPEFRAVLGKLFALKIALLLIVIVGSVCVERFFCRVLCPLGAIYGLLNSRSFFRLQFDETKCVECGRCRSTCPMAVDPTKCGNSIECIRCKKCAAQCPKQAIDFNFSSK